MSKAEQKQIPQSNQELENKQENDVVLTSSKEEIKYTLEDLIDLTGKVDSDGKQIDISFFKGIL